MGYDRPTPDHTALLLIDLQTGPSTGSGKEECDGENPGRR